MNIFITKRCKVFVEFFEIKLKRFKKTLMWMGLKKNDEKE